MGELQLAFNYNKYENAVGEVLLKGEIIKLNYSSVPSLKDFTANGDVLIPNNLHFYTVYCLF